MDDAARMSMEAEKVMEAAKMVIEATEKAGMAALPGRDTVTFPGFWQC